MRSAKQQRNVEARFRFWPFLSLFYLTSGKRTNGAGTTINSVFITFNMKFLGLWREMADDVNEKAQKMLRKTCL